MINVTQVSCLYYGVVC